jgi:hypothetical protein
MLNVKIPSVEINMVKYREDISLLDGEGII